MSSGNTTDSKGQGETSRGLSRSTRPKRTRNRASNGLIGNYVAQFGSEGDSSDDDSMIKKRRLGKNLAAATGTRQSSRVGSRLASRAASRTAFGEESSSSDIAPAKRGVSINRSLVATRSSGRTTRSITTKPATKGKLKSRYVEDASDELAGAGASESEHSEIVYVRKKAKKPITKERSTRSQAGANPRRGRPRLNVSSSESELLEPTRRSGRNRGAVKSLKERDMEEEIFADEVLKGNSPKVISIREIFQPLPKQSEFRRIHNNECDVCGQEGSHSNKGTSPLIYCQGCSTSIHKVCLGYRSGREHMVTKVGHEDFVMQCRRCIGVTSKKDKAAPQLDTCQLCKQQGRSCAAFSPRRTAKQEEKLREEHDGDDPVTEVPTDLLNNARNVLFRCSGCQRCYHYEHLPALHEDSTTPDDIEELRNERFMEYRSTYQCKECHEMASGSLKVQALVAWRPADLESYKPGNNAEMLREDEKEYLIKWEGKSYFKCTWMAGSWVWGITTVNMRKAFLRRDDGANMEPKWTSEEAIPEEYLRMEIVLDVDYEKGFRPQSEKSDKARIEHVDQVYVKFLGLTYDDAVWEEPPEPDDGDRWSDYVAAYNEYVAGRYLKQVPPQVMKERAEEFRSLNFEKDVELKKQPSALSGGQMMPYQMEGLNWLLYNFHQKKNVILADEMGLGKTIQIISLFASLVKDNPKACQISPF